MMRQILSVLLLVTAVAYGIVYLAGATALVSQAVPLYHRHEALAGEAVNLASNAPDTTAKLILLRVRETTYPLCVGDKQLGLGGWGSQSLGLNTGGQDTFPLDSGLVIPDDPPRYKLNLPNYDQLQVVLWANDSPFQIQPSADGPGMCSKPVSVHKIEQDAC